MFILQEIKNTFSITWLFKITVISTHSFFDFARQEHFYQHEDAVHERRWIHEIDRLHKRKLYNTKQCKGTRMTEIIRICVILI